MLLNGVERQNWIDWSCFCVGAVAILFWLVLERDDVLEVAVSGTYGKAEYRCLSWMRGGERCGSRQMPLAVNVGAMEGVGRRGRAVGIGESGVGGSTV